MGLLNPFTTAELNPHSYQVTRPPNVGAVLKASTYDAKRQLASRRALRLSHARRSISVAKFGYFPSKLALSAKNRLRVCLLKPCRSSTTKVEYRENGSPMTVCRSEAANEHARTRAQARAASISDQRDKHKACSCSHNSVRHRRCI